MKQFISLGLAAVFLFTAQLAHAKKFCLMDDFGETFQIIAGKTDKKSGTVLVHTNVLGCQVSGIANISLNGSGQHVLSMETGPDVTIGCLPVVWYAVGDEFLNSTGTYDRLGDGMIDGDITFTSIDCGLFGPQGTAHAVSKDAPVSRKTAEEK